MPKNEFICKFGVYNIGFNGHKNPQVNAAYHDYAHLIPIKLLFSSKKVPQCGIFIVRKKKFSITATIFSHSRSEHNFRKAQEIFLFCLKKLGLRSSLC